MSKFYTLNYLINSFFNGNKEVESLRTEINDFDDVMEFDAVEYEPSQKSIDAILSFVSQYEVLRTSGTGDIELNLN